MCAALVDLDLFPPKVHAFGISCTKSSKCCPADSQRRTHKGRSCRYRTKKEGLAVLRMLNVCIAAVSQKPFAVAVSQCNPHGPECDGRPGTTTHRLPPGRCGHRLASMLLRVPRQDRRQAGGRAAGPGSSQPQHRAISNTLPACFLHRTLVRVLRQNPSRHRQTIEFSRAVTPRSVIYGSQPSHGRFGPAVRLSLKSFQAPNNRRDSSRRRSAARP